MTLAFQVEPPILLMCHDTHGRTRRAAPRKPGMPGRAWRLALPSPARRAVGAFAVRTLPRVIVHVGRE